MTAMIVLAEAAAGRLSELTDWYAECHIPEMLRVAGIVSATQYQPVVTSGGEPPATLLMVYRLDTDDADSLIAELTARRPLMSSTSVLDAATVWIAHEHPTNLAEEQP